MRLRIEGVIIAKGKSQPRTHLGPKPAPEEACFDLSIEKAWLPNGRQQPTEELVNPTFVGPLPLLDDFETGDRVRLICTTISGRQIASIERVSDSDRSV